MKKIILASLLATTLLISCSPSKKTGQTTGATVTNSKDKDASSFEKAIAVPSVAAEYAWLREHYPGYKRKGQALTFQDKKPYDILTVELADGTEKKFYFDISSFFGKY